jgi:hypothetical protein
MASLAAALVCAVGCAQVLGLDSYGAAGDAGADATVDGVAPDGTIDAVTADNQPPPEAAGPDGADDSNDDAPLDAPGFDAGLDACAMGTTCAPPVPSGWTGPLVLWEGSGGAPQCGTGYDRVFEGGANQTMAGAQCSCACSLTGATCSDPVLSAQKTCRGMSCGMTSLPQGACADLSAFSAMCTVPSVSGSTATGGTCGADASMNVPSWGWGLLGVACAPSALPDAGCGPGGQCMPTPPSPFGASICVQQAGAVGCPGGGYSTRHVFYGGASDTRGCSACTCGSLSGVDCNANAHVVVWATTGCDGGASLEISPLPSACSSPAFRPLGATFVTTPSGGCTPVGGQPTGAIVPQNAMTICCTP